jgi:hypothetical protein
MTRRASAGWRDRSSRADVAQWIERQFPSPIIADGHDGYSRLLRLTSQQMVATLRNYRGQLTVCQQRLESRGREGHQATYPSLLGLRASGGFTRGGATTLSRFRLWLHERQMLVSARGRWRPE